MGFDNRTPPVVWWLSTSRVVRKSSALDVSTWAFPSRGQWRSDAFDEQNLGQHVNHLFPTQAQWDKRVHMNIYQSPALGIILLETPARYQISMSVTL